MRLLSRRYLLPGLAAVLVLAALLRALWPQPDEHGNKKEKAVPVSVTQALAQDYPLTLDTVGRVQASENVTLKARVDGMVTEVLLPEGRAVKKGDVLIRLDDADLRTRLAQAEAVLARDAAQLANARIELARNEQLKEKNYVSDDLLRTSRTNVAALDATVKGDRAAVESTRLQVSYTVIRAPFDGRAGARLVFPGTLVKTSDTTLAVIYRTHPVQVTFAVPERYLGQLRTLRNGGRMKVTVSSDTDAGLKASGNADFIDNAVDTGSGTIQVRATFGNSDDRLTPGAFVKVSLDLETLKSAITVPAAAVQQNGDNSTVYIVDASKKARLRKIKVRDIRNDTAIIAEGINAGETVITSGQLRLTPDASVQIRKGR
ncbi:MAG: efflux RND transporter periplasmic adaptor subunit [bacterium]|nr:efflux RND transporter periplasmic adaptor subunit [bacterium]